MVDKTYFAQVPEILWFSPNGKGRTYIWSCSVTNFMTRESRDALKNSNLDGHSNQTNKSDPRGRMCFHLVCVKSGCKCCQKVHFCKKMLGRETRAESVESGSSAAGKLRVIGLHWTCTGQRRFKWQTEYAIKTFLRRLFIDAILGWFFFFFEWHLQWTF